MNLASVSIRKANERTAKRKISGKLSPWHITWGDNSRVGPETVRRCVYKMRSISFIGPCSKEKEKLIKRSVDAMLLLADYSSEIENVDPRWFESRDHWNFKSSSREFESWTFSRSNRLSIRKGDSPAIVVVAK